MRDPKKGRTVFCERRVRRYEFIEKASGKYPLRHLFEAAKVSRSGYYAWRARLVEREDRRAEVRVAVKEKFYCRNRTYGSKRISDELKDEGIRVGRYLTRRIMREEGLEAKAPKRYRPKTTDSKNTTDPSPNLLKDVKKTELKAGEAIVGDITYLPMRNGQFCYLATFQDVVTKRVVGWDVAPRMPAELVCNALKMGLRRGSIKRNAIIHTDRGSQYSSKDFRKLLKDRLRQSMSAKGNCYDNAMAESFFSRFKTEIDTQVFDSVEEAKSAAFDYIDCFYNRTRRHTTLGTTIPEFERRLKNGEPAMEMWKSPKQLSHIPTAPAANNKLKGENENFLS